MRERAAKAGLSITVEIPPGLPPIRADQRALKQILLNLLSNAVKFTPAGGRITLQATLEPDGGVAFRVRDTGIGIAAADLPKALEPFGQVDSSLARQLRGRRPRPADQPRAGRAASRPLRARQRARRRHHRHRPPAARPDCCLKRFRDRPRRRRPSPLTAGCHPAVSTVQMAAWVAPSRHRSMR